MRTSPGSGLARTVEPGDVGSMTKRVAVTAAAVLVVVGCIVLAFFAWSMWYFSDHAQGGRGADYEIRAGRGCLLSRGWAHVDPVTGLVVARTAHGNYCGLRGPDVRFAPSGSDELVEGWNATVRRRVAEGDRCGPHFRDRIVTLAALRERFLRDAAAAITVPADDVAVFGDHEVRWRNSSVIVRSRGSPKWKQPAGGAPDEPDLDRDTIDVAALTADDGRTLWVRVASKTNDDVWYFVVDLETGTNFEVFDASAGRR